MRTWLLIGVWMSVHSALAQGICAPPDDRLTDARALRARALQVLGRLPTPEELADPDPDALLDQWLDTDAFAQQAVRHHVGLLWPNPGVFRQDLGSFIGADGTPIYFRRSAVAAYRRQGPERTNVPEHCGPADQCPDQGRCADISVRTGVEGSGLCAPRGCNWFTGDGCQPGQKCNYAIRGDGATVGSCFPEHGQNQLGSPCV